MQHRPIGDSKKARLIGETNFPAAADRSISCIATELISMMRGAHRAECGCSSDWLQLTAQVPKG